MMKSCYLSIRHEMGLVEPFPTINVVFAEQVSLFSLQKFYYQFHNRMGMATPATIHETGSG